ncbi:hypothetical protein appser10_3630 [Actinobacillus pleuropneumoniae serovar 10 str. D13039]|nr:hypothetical protein appser10_3630 [Actinobacillus pleuropneumoniae serovar 10 str. D13039]
MDSVQTLFFPLLKLTENYSSSGHFFGDFCKKLLKFNRLPLL